MSRKIWNKRGFSLKLECLVKAARRTSGAENEMLTSRIRHHEKWLAGFCEPVRALPLPPDLIKED